MVGASECGNEFLGSIKCGEFRDKLTNCLPLRKVYAPWREREGGERGRRERGRKRAGGREGRDRGREGRGESGKGGGVIGIEGRERGERVGESERQRGERGRERGGREMEGESWRERVRTKSFYAIILNSMCHEEKNTSETFVKIFFFILQ